MVVANLLQSRHTKVTIVTEEGEEEKERGESEIEQLIVDKIISKHSNYTSSWDFHVITWICNYDDRKDVILHVNKNDEISSEVMMKFVTASVHNSVTMTM